MLSLPPLLLLTFIFIAYPSLSFVFAATVPPYTCNSSVLPISVSVNTTVLHLATPANQSEISGLTQELFSATSNASQEILGGPRLLEATYDVWTQLCVPNDFEDAGIVEFATHGINFDHFYWQLGGNDSQYNYIEAAISAGHAILAYDRLGTGLSSTPDGIQDLQITTEIAVAARLVSYLRSGVPVPSQAHNSSYKLNFGRIIAIGHSYGSYILLGMAATYGSIVNDTILTGFSTYTAGFPVVFAGLGFMIASAENSTVFGNLDNTYMATSSILNVQQIFFLYPYFPPELLQQAEDHKGTMTFGQFLTIAQAFSEPATKYTGRVMIVSGDKDIVVCGGNCYQIPVNSTYTNLLSPAAALFPSASNFDIYIPADCGHAINGHYAAPEVYGVVQEWING